MLNILTKTKIILACHILLICATTHAMELVPLTPTAKKNFQIRCLQDISKLPLKYIRPCFNLLPEKKRHELLTTKNKNGIPLAESLIFNVALLEEEKVQLQILTFMMDGDELSAHLFHKKPFWYVQRRYHSAKKMIEKSSLIKQPIALLFRLPIEQQKEIMGIVTPSFTSQLMNDTAIIIHEYKEEEIKLYDQEIQKNNSVLPCGHMFCEECLVKIHAQAIVSHQQDTRCPKCNACILATSV